MLIILDVEIKPIEVTFIFHYDLMKISQIEMLSNPTAIELY